MPISQRVEDSLETEGLQMASKHTAIPDSNKGFQMLQRMGWKGRGLGSNEDGDFQPSPSIVLPNPSRNFRLLFVEIQVLKGEHLLLTHTNNAEGYL